MIDFVIPWVNGNDPEWKQEYNKYKYNETGDTRRARFRDWKNLRYWFRGVEKFAPWVDQVHFITCGHLPNWLNPDHQKLNIVNHKDYIPKKYLPTFNARTIELNLHRIKELNEKYVFFNDDFFLIDHVKESLFFRNEKPCDMPVTNALAGTQYSLTLLKDVSIINKHFSKYEAIKKNPLKWFNPKYGFFNIRNIFLLPWYKHTGFYNLHLPQPCLKSTLEVLWRKEYDELNKSCNNRFRKYATVNMYLQRYWELASNNFEPVNIKKYGEYFELHKENLENVERFIVKQKKKMISFNDMEVINFDLVRKKINLSLQKILSKKSDFEKF